MYNVCIAANVGDVGRPVRSEADAVPRGGEVRDQEAQGREASPHRQHLTVQERNEDTAESS